MRSFPAIIGGVLALLLVAGCRDLEPPATFEPITDPARLYMALVLDHRAVNLSVAAPYNTLQLTATPRNALGEAMSGLPAPTFRSSDMARVSVSPDGLIEAREPVTGVQVIAELVVEGNVRHADTAIVNVTGDSTPPALVTFSIDPMPPDGGTWPMFPVTTGGALEAYNVLLPAGLLNFFLLVPVRALDAAGNPIPGLAIEYRSLDPDVVDIDARTGMVTTRARPGQAAIVARTTAYGVTMADTAIFTVTLPAVHGILIDAAPGKPPRFRPAEVAIRPNGLVFWVNHWTGPVAVTFDDPSNVAEATEVCARLGDPFCGAGDIAAFDGSGGVSSSEAMRVRRFPMPGVYIYRVTGTGIDGTGRIVVVEN